MMQITTRKKGEFNDWLRRLVHNGINFSVVVESYDENQAPKGAFTRYRLSVDSGMTYNELLGVIEDDR